MDNKPKYYNQSRNKATQRYLAKHMEQLRIWVYKDDHVKERVKVAATRRGISSAEYMRTAITDRLDADNATIDDL